MVFNHDGLGCGCLGIEYSVVGIGIKAESLYRSDGNGWLDVRTRRYMLARVYARVCWRFDGWIDFFEKIF